ncbi:MAG: gluconokinase [Verrucomicrobiae bacterium]|nr:gluconokinase [Verrucomicrobiae bacterium]
MASLNLILLMGPSGCGKSTVGPLLADRIGGIYLEGDDFHPPENKAKMGAGMPLTDADRWPWFENLRAAIYAAHVEAPESPVVLSCSALKRKYREFILTGYEDSSRLVFMRGSKELIAGRLSDRVHEYMPATLLDSQFAALEAPEADESPLIIDIGESPEALADRIAAQL